MLNEFMIGIFGGQNQTSIDNFEYAMVMMEDYRNKYKDELRIPKGTRYNWFPLVLLDKYVARHGKKAHDERIDCAVIFMALLQDSSVRSFYLDKCEVLKPNSTLRLYYRSNDNQKMAIHRIMTLFNLQFRIDEL